MHHLKLWTNFLITMPAWNVCTFLKIFTPERWKISFEIYFWKGFPPKSKTDSVLPSGPTCGQDTYKQRVDQRRKRVVQDLNVSLTTKYKLQPAEYSPPNTLLRHNTENLSAISGPLLPSGPNLCVESPKLPNPNVPANSKRIEQDVSRSNRIRQDSSSSNSDFEEIIHQDQAYVSSFFEFWLEKNNFECQKS